MWIKICGIKDVATAQAVVAAGANAIGLNFYQPSVRCVEVSTATEIVAAVGSQVEPVGVFVNHALEEIIATCRATNLTSIQLHGDESPEFIATLQEHSPAEACGPLKTYRAFRVDRESGCVPISEYLAKCRELGVCLAGCLVDALIPGEYGGTGHTAPWDLLSEQYDSDRWPRLIVAGGLTPENVANAIQATAPFGIDVASGVESERGVKDLTLVRNFVAAASRRQSRSD